MTVRNASKQASFLECVGSLRTRRHLARLFEGVCRACILAATVPRDFLRDFPLHDHILILVSHQELLKLVSASFRRSSGLSAT
jgi:hypothetical protein